ncbi:MAG: response regulator [Opitutaceae bacterium]
MTHPPPPHPLRILVVENHHDTRKYLTKYLQGAGHCVTTAETMNEALAAALESDCEVLISDIGLPDGDGWELLERARFPRPIYAIAMSGYGMDKDREKSRTAGFRHHLLKPIDVVQLKKILAEAGAELSAPPPVA